MKRRVVSLARFEARGGASVNGISMIALGAVAVVAIGLVISSLRTLAALRGRSAGKQSSATH